ncbi:MAG: 4Fe-4S dicluster domain-containing protein [Dehalococcoidales bacterium]|nr:4Fe-4S dicluster domain-containing protein [Dehalococcoidales bacterium]
MTVTELPQTIIPNPSWHNKVEEQSGQKVSACYQCEKCTNGCPVTFAMDIAPHKLIHAVQLGLKEEVLCSNTFWVCAACETCTTRCPNGIDIAHIMDTLKHMSLLEGTKPARKDVPIFHTAFLSSIKRYGRMNEFGMVADYTLRSEGPIGLLRQAGTGLKMFIKGKLKLLPPSRIANKQVSTIFGQTERQG